MTVREETIAALEKKRSERQKATDDNHSSEAEEKKIKQADVLIALARQNGLDLFRTPDGEAYADLTMTGHRETWPLRSSGFRKWLRRNYFFELQTAPNKDAVESAIDTLDAEAQFDCDKVRPVYLRVAYLDGKIYVDLCDAEWRAVEVDRKGWRVVATPPVRFRRTSSSRPQVVPIKGKLSALKNFVNLSGDSYILLVSVILKAFYEPGGFPILELVGTAGTAKTTLGKILFALIDPNVAGMRNPPAEEKDLGAAVHGNYLLGYDNLSSIPGWMSDAFCRVSTGGSIAARTLYTNAEETIVVAKRPMIFTGINPLALRGDLSERATKLFLEEIAENKRQAEAEFEAAFEAARPGILGGITTALSIGLRNIATVQERNLPRMADYARWAIACEPAYTAPGGFMAAFNRSRGEAHEQVVENSVPASALRIFMARKGPDSEWTGTASQLFMALKLVATEMEIGRDRFPTDGQRLMRELRNAQAALKAIGIKIEQQQRTNSARLYKVTFTKAPAPTEPPDPPGHPEDAKTASLASPASPANDSNGLGVTLTGDAEDGPASPPSPASAPASRTASPSVTASVTANPLKSNGSDAGDANDAKIPSSGCLGREPHEAPRDPGPFPDILRRDVPPDRRPALGPEGDSLDDFK